MKPISLASVGLALLWMWPVAGQTPFDIFPPFNPPRTDPNSIARQQLAQVEVKDIASMRFTGNAFDLARDEAIEVTNLQDIRTFLVSLRHGREPYGFLQDIMNVEFKPVSGQARESVSLRFDAQNPAMSYNREFYDAVYTILEAAQVKRVRKIVSDNASKVKALVLFGNLRSTDHVIITAPQEIRRLLTAMQQVDVRAFVFTRPPQSRLVVYLCLQADPTGDYSDLRNAIRISFLPDGLPGSKFKQKPPLPPEIWKYCSSR